MERTLPRDSIDNIRSRVPLSRVAGAALPFVVTLGFYYLVVLRAGSGTGEAGVALLALLLIAVVCPVAGYSWGTWWALLGVPVQIPLALYLAVMADYVNNGVCEGQQVGCYDVPGMVFVFVPPFLLQALLATVAGIIMRRYWSRLREELDREF